MKELESVTYSRDGPSTKAYDIYVRVLELFSSLGKNEI